MSEPQTETLAEEEKPPAAETSAAEAVADSAGVDVEDVGDDSGEGADEDTKRQIGARIAQIMREADDLRNVTRKQIKRTLKATFPAHYQTFKAWIKLESQRAVDVETERRQALEDAAADGVDDEPADVAADRDDDDTGTSSRRRAKRKRTRVPKRKRIGPARPGNAYNFFMADEKVKQELEAEYPGLRGPDLFKRRGEKWKALTAADKTKYESRAREDKKRYEKEMAEFRKNNPELIAEQEREREEAAAQRRQKKRKRKQRDGGDGDTKFDEEDDAPEDQAARAPPSKLELLWQEDKELKRRSRQRISEEEMRERAQRFCDQMQEAYFSDRGSMEAGAPAVKKLMMLDQVVAQLSKAPLMTKREEERTTDRLDVVFYLKREGIMERIKEWLSPNPDGTLPQVEIRTALYKTLSGLVMDEMDLKQSNGLPIVLGDNLKNRHETPANRRIIKAMMTRWIRDITERSDKYGGVPNFSQQQQRRIMRRKKLLQGNNSQVQSRSTYSSFMVPRPVVMDYAYVPAAMSSRSFEDGGGRSNASRSRNL